MANRTTDSAEGKESIFCFVSITFCVMMTTARNHVESVQKSYFFSLVINQYIKKYSLSLDYFPWNILCPCVLEVDHPHFCPLHSLTKSFYSLSPIAWHSFTHQNFKTLRISNVLSSTTFLKNKTDSCIKSWKLCFVFKPIPNYDKNVVILCL